MRAGFLDALRHAAATGELPTSATRQAQEGQEAPSLVEQLTASLEAQSAPVRTLIHRTGVTAPPGSLTPGGRSPERATGGRGPSKGSLAQALGEATEDRADLVQAALDREVQPPLPLQPLGAPAEPLPPSEPLTATGRAAKRAAGDTSLYESPDVREAPRPWATVGYPPLRGGRDARGDDHDGLLGGGDLRVGAGAAGVGDRAAEDRASASLTPQTSPGRPALSYDLPTLIGDLPLFCSIGGQAGVGKTFWAKAVAEANEGCVLTATTGIAAVNLGEGTTINSLLKFFDSASLRDAFTGGWLEALLVKHRKAGMRRILLDEKSLLSGDQLTILCRAIDNVNAQRRLDEDEELGLILLGDFGQLPPIKEPFAFESAEWDRFAEHTLKLTKVWRQADRDFIEALQAVRVGQVGRALEFFADRLEQYTDQEFQGTTIMAKNDAVDKFNGLVLDKLKGAAITFPSSRWGSLRREWGGPPKPPHEWGVPEVLKLKLGALVMILANRNVAERGMPAEYLYVNGDLGTIVDAANGTVRVQLQRTGEQVTVIPITRENLIPLEVGRRKALKAEGHPERVSPDGKHEVIGSVSYLPIRAAWASTCHKSQGLSLSSVQINLRDPFWRTGGMVYVGLSRARTAEGLRMVGNVQGFRSRAVVDPRVVPWL